MNYRALCLFLCLALIWPASVAQPFGRRHCRPAYYAATTCQVTAVQPDQPVQPADISNLPADAQEAIEHFHKEVASKAPELHEDLHNILEGIQNNLVSTGQQSAAAAVAAYLEKLPEPKRLKDPDGSPDPFPAAVPIPEKKPKGKRDEGARMRELPTPPPTNQPRSMQSKIDALYAAVQAYKSR
jgi:hypothetical protein